MVCTVIDRLWKSDFSDKIHKTAVAWPLVSHLTNHLSNTNIIYTGEVSTN